MRNMAEAFEKGDLKRYSEFLADDVTYYMPGKNQISGDYHGVEAIPGIWDRQGQFLVSMYRVKTYDMAATHQHIIMLAEVTAQREDVTYHDRTANVYRVAAGKIVEAWPFIFDLYAFDSIYA